ncbi:NAD(P)-dependent dehydrogenase (short-subunit alcohol dehydrogenase family) [Aliiruegeria haliotis]|uniref:NAD(P)-dependent dehydrogenase (Short-subunit alcohol dehydrogenase family) n=1 Tax=Aliiruegeria haliotis TaxID=1280846 RepID=A0A2T0RYP2_9RHOB|nr:SDR family NAD(P)-dependent oxidoreductase [Aliiruegeria haliotis]PRY26294.1 NAD(P)-dependent dehydrogenase (short-subunit alcohol dehydrogenase family) [Aliiruegeria haliotis]
MEVSNAKVIVTGGASGLGRATAEGFLDAGAAVTVFDLAGEAPDGAGFRKVDVTDPEAAAAAIDSAAETMGGLSVAVNCAGIATGEKTLGRDGPHSYEGFQRTVTINLLGSFNIARLAAAKMARNAPNEDEERGVIINTASIAAFEGQKGQAAYSASKAGIAGLSLPMARDLARDGIRVMAIAPGIFLTPMLMSLPQEVQDGLAADVTFPKRLGDPREFCALARFIVACPYLNGTTIRLDGALRMQ